MEEVQAKFRAIYRIIVFIGIVIQLLCEGYFIHFTVKEKVLRRKRFTRLAQKIMAKCVKRFNIYIDVKNPPPENEVCLQVGNHMGFIDILAVGSLYPTCFVTSREMRETPVLGLLTEMGGCIYVERRKRANIVNEMQEMAREMQSGLRVLLYPEATSTNGEQVLPFKKTLMMSAAYANCPIRPYVFNYRLVNSEPVEFKHRDYVCWYGDQNFVAALWRSLQLVSVNVEIEFLPPIYPKPDDDRSFVAEKAYEMVSAKFDPFRNPARGLDALDQLNV